MNVPTIKTAVDVSQDNYNSNTLAVMVKDGNMHSSRDSSNTFEKAHIMFDMMVKDGDDEDENEKEEGWGGWNLMTKR